jgi:capsular polysaccharide biosynthesis protein
VNRLTSPRLRTTQLRTPRATRWIAALLLVGLTLVGAGAGWAVEAARGPQFQVRTDVLVRFWSIESYLLTGQGASVSSLDVADAATLAQSRDVLSEAAAQLADGQTAASLARSVTVTPQSTSNSVTIVATAADEDTARATSEAVAAAMIAAVSDRISNTASSLSGSASGDVTSQLLQRAQALTSSVQPLEALGSGEPQQTSPSSRTPIALAIVGLAAGTLLVIALVFGRPVVGRGRDAQRLLELPVVDFGGATLTPSAGRLVRRLLDDRPVGSLLVVPIDADGEKAARQFVDWATGQTVDATEAARIVLSPEVDGTVLRPRPTSEQVAAVLLVVPAGTVRRDLTDASSLLSAWRAPDAVVVTTRS